MQGWVILVVLRSTIAFRGQLWVSRRYIILGIFVITQSCDARPFLPPPERVKHLM